MNFIKKYEIFPQNSDLLKKHLYKELIEEKSKNKVDHHIDQVRQLLIRLNFSSHIIKIHIFLKN